MTLSPCTSRAARRLLAGLGRPRTKKATRHFTASSTSKPLDLAYAPVNPFQMNQYAIACTATRQAALVDCGASTPQELDPFLKWIGDNGYTLTAVWQTHAHLDHVAGLGMLRSLPEYADIPIYLDPKDKDIYNNFEQRCEELGFQVEGNAELPEESQLTFFSEDDTTVTLGELTFDIISTPGHCPGQVGFLESTTKSFLGGDFIMQGSIGRTDFPESSHADMQASLERFVQTMDDETILYPGHGPATTLKHEKQTNPFLRPFL